MPGRSAHQPAHLEPIMQHVHSRPCIMQQVHSCACIMQHLHSYACIMQYLHSYACIMQHVQSCPCIMQHDADRGMVDDEQWMGETNGACWVLVDGTCEMLMGVICW